MANALGNEGNSPQQLSSTCSSSQQDEMGGTRGSSRKGEVGEEGWLAASSEPQSCQGRLPELWKCVIVAIMLDNLNDISVHDSKALVWEAVEVIGNDSPQ